MSWGEIAGAAIGGIGVIFVILSWAGIVPKKFSEAPVIKRLVAFDVLSLITLAVIGTIIYLAVSEKEIPGVLIVLASMLVVWAYYRSK
jgi:Ca2+/Na+ antiporter